MHQYMKGISLSCKNTCEQRTCIKNIIAIYQNLTVWLEINCMKKSVLVIRIRVIFLVNIAIVVPFFMVDFKHLRYFDV